MDIPTPLTGVLAGFLGAAFTAALTSAGLNTAFAIGIAGVLTGLVGLVAMLVSFRFRSRTPS